MEIIILLILSIALQITIFHKLKNQIMSAEQVVKDTNNEILALLVEAFNTNVGDFTEAEAQAERESFKARALAILNGTPPPPTE
jgi:glutamate/tyrosine decarboxylase-like PLP-dependent enzyme